MRSLESIAHTVRRLHATCTTDELIRYVEHEVGESYARGFAAGFRRREDTAFRSLLWHTLRRGVRRGIRRLLRRMVSPDRSQPHDTLPTY
jgi:hypothetical protein